MVFVSGPSLKYLLKYKIIHIIGYLIAIRLAGVMYLLLIPDSWAVHISIFKMNIFMFVAWDNMSKKNLGSSFEQCNQKCYYPGARLIDFGKGYYRRERGGGGDIQL